MKKFSTISRTPGIKAKPSKSADGFVLYNLSHSPFKAKTKRECGPGETSKTFSLVDGSNLNGEDYSIATYPVKIEGNEVFVGFLE